MRILIALLLATALSPEYPECRRAGCGFPTSTTVDAGDAVSSGGDARGRFRRPRRGPARPRPSSPCPTATGCLRHFHPMGEQLEVRQGNLLVTMGERSDIRKADTLRTGDRAFAPAGARTITRSPSVPTVIALTFDGPYTITYVRDAYEAPKGYSVSQWVLVEE